MEEKEKSEVFLKDISAQEKTIFLGGSQTCTYLPEEAKAKLDVWMHNNAQFLIGDCKGADQLMQKYLHENGYGKVWVYVSGDEVRHNEGGWEVIHCHTSAAPHSYEFYKIKDQAMADFADLAFMLWDGKSIGTRENIIEMREQEKPVTILRISKRGGDEENISNFLRMLKRYDDEENISISSAVRRCPRAGADLHLKRDETFMLQRMTPDHQPDPAATYRPFLSFTDVLEAIRDEMVQLTPDAPKPTYTLEKWTSKGDFNLTFFRFRDELIEVEPPDEDFHMEQTAVFYLEGDEVTGYHLLPDKRKPGKGKKE